MKKFVQIVSVVALIAILAAVCFACVPGSVEKAKEKMDKAGYVAVAYTNSDAEDCDGWIGATTLKNSLTAWHFTSSKAAKAYYDDLTDGNKYENLGISGKWVYYGSEDAIKAFKK